jgi:hypothetical protein
MTAVMVELTRKPEPVLQDPEDIIPIADVDALLADALPGCGDDNPYN